MNESDRRGRRASWIAAALFIVLCVIVFRLLGPWFARERYVRLREHEMRRNRFTIEALISRAEPADVSGVLLVSIDAMREKDWRDVDATPTLDSLRALGGDIVIEGVSPDADAAFSGVVIPVVQAGREMGFATAAVVGHTMSDSTAALLRDFDHVRNDFPAITSYHHEGEATWVSLAAVRELTAGEGEPMLLWLRYTELSPPHLGHDRLRIGNPRVSELNAIDHYLGQILAFIRAVECEERVAILVIGSEADESGRMRGIAVHADLADTVDAGDLSLRLLSAAASAE